MFVFGSEKRLVLVKFSQEHVIQIIDNLCLFKNNPLIDFVLRNTTIYCLEKRSVSIIELADSKIKENKIDSDRAKVNTPSKAKVVQPMTRTFAQKQLFQVSPSMPIFHNLEDSKNSMDSSTKQIKLPFDVQGVKRISYEAFSNKIYFGSQMLHFLEFTHGVYKMSPQRIGLSFFSMISTSNGFLLLNDFVSNDLVILDRNLKEVNRYSGIPDLRRIDNDNYKYIQQSEECSLWLSASCKVVKIHYETLTMEDISLFDLSFQEEYNPYVYLIQGTREGRYYGAAVFHNKGTCLFLSEHEMTNVVPLNNINGQMKEVDSLLYDAEADLLFVGGTTHLERKSRKASAIVYVLEINQKASLRAMKMWDLFSQTVSCIKKGYGLYYLATRGAVQVLSYQIETNELIPIRSIVHHPGMFINDLCIFNKILLSVAENDDCINVTSLDFISPSLN